GLGPGQPDQYTIYGELCNPAGGPSQTVQLLVAGATYGHVYWDFPYQPQTYSYVRALNAVGYSTFNIDRIGVGNSSHPLSALVTLDADAYSVHKVVQGLRTGTIGGQTFAHVLLVGHSLGSLTSWIEAGTYKDVDGVIITGLTHHFNTVQLTTVVVPSFYPAQLDPRFAGKGLDTGYLTTRQGTRGNDFYYVPEADPQAIATDEATKETVTSGELASFAPPFINGISERITVPVFVVMGQQDNLFCAPLATNCSSNATLQQAEAPFYAPQAQLQVAIIPNAGHDINLHLAAPTWFAASTTWALQHVAP
ncbi:MAG TPA: alpha/beta hydrolase, partial [Ktedonobacteraceae bacterium]|nr:alpha/beta hydrolase [Ktedonobacteraceae bacterium]